MAEKIITDHPEFFKLSDGDKQKVITQNFKEMFKGNPEFENAAPEQQRNIQLAHQQFSEEVALNSDFNPSKARASQNQEAADDGGLIYNLGAAGIRSHEQALVRAPLVNDLFMGGEIDQSTPKQFAKLYEKQNEAPITREAKRLAATLKRWNERTEAGGFPEDVAATAEMVADIASNPKAILGVAAESLASMTTMGAGAKVGAALGTLAAGPAGAAVGAPAGMFIAESLDAGTAKWAEKTRERLEAAGVPLTESNIAAFMQANQSLVKQDQADSMKYGGVLAAVDVLTGGFFSKLATLPTRVARREAMRSIDDIGRATIAEAAKATNRTVKDVTEDIVSGKAREILATQSFKSKLGHKTVSYLGEVAGEPLSEAVATAAIGEEIVADDLTYETLGSIGMGPIGAAINTAAMGTKLTGSKTTDFTKKIISSTPESRAAAKTQNNEIEAAKLQARAKSDVNYKKDFAAVDPADPVVDTWIDPKSETYDPIKAVNVLAKAQATDIEAFDKANKVYSDYRASMTKTEEKMDVLEAEAFKAEKAGDKAKAIRLGKELSNLMEVYELNTKTATELHNRVTVMANKAADLARNKKAPEINLETATEEEVTEHIITSLGSSPSNRDQIQAMIDKGGRSPEVTELLTNMKEAADLRQDLSDRSVKKSMAQVSDDIYHGMSGSEFKGIDAYQHAIDRYLSKSAEADGGLEKAEKQLEGLRKFRDAHQLKSERMSQVFEAMQNSPDGKLSPGIQKVYEALKKDYAKSFDGKKKKEIFLHKGSGDFVATVAQEALALNKEVATAELKFKVRNGGTPGSNTSTPISIQTPAVEPPVAPAADSQPAESVTEAARKIDYSTKSDGALQRVVDAAKKVGREPLSFERQAKLIAAKTEIGKRAKAKTNTKSAKSSNENIAPKEAAVETIKNPAESPTEDQPKVVQENKPEDTNTSPVSDNAATVVAIEEDLVNDPQTKAYNEAVENIEKMHQKIVEQIDKEISEYEQVLNCIEKG